MQQLDRNAPLAVLTEAVTYFLAGCFIISTFIPLLSSGGQVNSLDRIINYVIITIGVIVILTGFLCVLALLVRREGLGRWLNRLRFCLLLVLFPITLPQVLPVLFDFNNLVLSIPAGIFLVLVIFAIIRTSWPVLAISTVRLLTLSLALIGSTIIVLFQTHDPIQVAMILVVVFVLVTFALLNIRRNEERQLRFRFNPTLCDRIKRRFKK